MRTIIGVFALVGGFMLLEARRAATNERAQRARGGVEPKDDVYPVMRVAYPAAFAAMMAEAVVRGAPSATFILGGLLLFAAAKALRWWAMLALGPCWTFRVIVVPGMPLVAGGPYRYVRHPNYVAVVGELTGIALATGARIAGPLAIAGFGLLMLKRIAVEERALGWSTLNPGVRSPRGNG